VQERGHPGLRAGGQHQVLSRVLGHQLEEEVESTERLLLRVDAAKTSPTGSKDPIQFSQTIKTSLLRGNDCGRSKRQ